MSIQADIDAKVGAFLAEMADLVRSAALQIVREALAPQGEEGVRTVPRPRPASKPARAKPAVRRSAPEPAAAPPAPAPRSLKDPRRGRLITVPSTPPPPLVEEHPMPVVVKVPAKVARKKRTPKPEPVSPQPAAAAEPTPARNWVVVRRPARDRREPGAEPAEAAGAADAPPPDGAPAPEARVTGAPPTAAAPANPTETV